MTEAPTSDPKTGRPVEAPLVGAGAGADSAAKAALTEAAAKRTAQAIFFISMAGTFFYILNNLAHSDVDLQDLVAGADSISSREWKDDQRQVYYVYEIDGTGAHSLISVTCAKNKLYAHFVNAPTPEWNRDQETLRHIHETFRTMGLY